jgi:hypothetical protein
MGTTYLFKVQARNSEGYGAFSNEVSILAAQPPDQPAIPTTTWVPANILHDHYENPIDNVVVNWSEPIANGAEITAYTLYFRGSDYGDYMTTSACDGSDPVIFANLECTVPVSVFKAAPYNLPWGEHMWAKVEAINIQGSSVESNPGDGAFIIVKPDAPINLAEQY